MVSIFCEFVADDPEFEGGVRQPPVDETYFFVPVHFVIDGVDLMETRSGRHVEIPVLHLARYLPPLVRQMPTGGKEVYAAPGGGVNLAFAALDDKRVEVVTSLGKRRATTLKSELLADLTGFEQELRRLMRRHVPWLANYPYWQKWIDGKASDCDWGQLYGPHACWPARRARVTGDGKAARTT
jgi:hypothetical protein